MALSVSAFPASSRKQPAADRAPEPSQSQNVTDKLRTRLSLRGLFRWASKSTRENDHLHTSRSPALSSPPISSPLSSSARVFPPQSPLQSLNSSPPGLRCTESRCFPPPDQQPEPDTHPQLAHQDIGKATNFPVVPAHAVLNPPAMVVHERLRMDRLRALSLTRTLPVPVPQRSIAGDSGTGSVSASASAVVGGHRKNTAAVSSSPHHSQIHVAQASLVQMPPLSVLEEIKKEAFPAPAPTTPSLTPNPGGYIRPLPPVPSPPPHPLPVIPVRSSSRVPSRSTSLNMRTRTRSTPDASHSLSNLRHHSPSGSPHSRSHRLTDRSDHSLLVSRGPLLRPDMLPSRALLVPVPVYSPSVSASQSALAVAPPYSSQSGTSKPPMPLLDLSSRPSLTLLPPDKMLGPIMPLETEAAPFQAPVVYPEDGDVFTVPELTLPAHGPTSEHIGENHHDGRPNSRAPDSLISWDPEGIDEPGLNPPELARISGTLSIGDDERYAPVMEDYSSLFSRIPSPIYCARPSSQGSLSDEQSPKREPMLRTMAFSDNDARYGKITDDDSSEFSSVPSPIYYARPSSQGSLLDDLPFELPPISSVRAIGDNDHRNGKVTEDDSSGFSSIPSPICYARPSSEGSLSDDLPLFSTSPWSRQRTHPSLYGTPDNSVNQTLSSATGSGSKSLAEPNTYRSTYDEVKHTSSFGRNISPTRHQTPSRSVTVDGSKMHQLSLFTRSPSPKRNVRPGRAVTADGSGTGQLPLFTRSPSPKRHLRPSRALTADSSKMVQLSFTSNPSPNQYVTPSGVVMADHSKMDQLPTFTRSPSPRRRLRSPRAATADSGAMGQLSLFARSPSPKRHRRPGRAATADSAVNREGKSSRSGFLRVGSRSSFPPGNYHGSACGIGRVRAAESYTKDLKETSSDVRNGNGKGSSTGGRETATKGDARKGWTSIGMDNVVQDLVVVRTVRPKGDGREEKAVAEVVPKLRKMKVSSGQNQ